MGAHKGKKKMDKLATVRYFSENHRRRNKISRIRRCNGKDFLAQWLKENPA